MIGLKNDGGEILYIQRKKMHTYTFVQVGKVKERKGHQSGADLSVIQLGFT